MARSRITATGRPRNVAEEWDVVYDGLRNPFWSHKGLSATCPYCHGESSSGKMRFLIMFEDGRFRSWGCYSCGEFGRGFSGISRLADHIGIELSTVEKGIMTGDSTGSREGWTRHGRADDGEDDGAVIDWPPPWLKETDDVIVAGVEYMEKRRGLKNAIELISKYGIRFSKSVEIEVGGVVFEREHPCVIVPMHGESGDVLGWMTRRIDGTDEPKSLTRGGRGWKTKSLFGIQAVDPRRPVVVLEGFFSALSTPNPVALGGKTIGDGQISLLAKLGAKVYVFALDPGVEKRKYTDAMYRLSLIAPGSVVRAVDWEEFGGYSDDDANDRGYDAMCEIIRKTVLGTF